MKIILASQSPRRKELLEKIDRVFTVEPSHYDEQLDVTRPTEEVARELALGKARDVARRFPEAIVIGADTIVEIDGEQLGKPHDEEEAVAMLRRLRGRSHHVVTGVAVVAHGQEYVAADQATVLLAAYTEEDIASYVRSGEPMDKAGAYGIQSLPAHMIDRIEGDKEAI